MVAHVGLDERRPGERAGPRLGLGLFAYVLPVVATQFVVAPFATVLPGIYVTHFGLDAVVVGMALMFMRVADAVTDPVVGYLSDRTRSRLGARKPWLIGGALMATLSAFLVLSPGGEPSVWRLVGWGTVFYLGWTMMEIPHAAWGAELSSDHRERTSIFFYRAVAGVVGAMGFAALPFLPVFESTTITPVTLGATAVAFAVLAPITVGAAVVGAPPGRLQDAGAARVGWREFMLSLARNRPLWMFLGAYTMAGIAFGMFGSLQYVYLQSYLDLGPRVAHALGVSFVGGMASLPLWLVLVKRWGKHRAWCAGLAIISACMVGMTMLPPGAGSFWLYVPLAGVLALSSGAGLIAPYSLLGDIVDYDTLRTRQRRGGSYFALFTLVVKGNIAVGGGFAFMILGWAGYDAAAGGSSGSWGLLVGFGALPAVITLAAAAILWRFPLDQRRQDVIRRRLAALDRRECADAC